MTPDKKSAAQRHHLLVLNGGSSSLKFAVYELNGDEEVWLSGKLTRIGLPDGQFTTIDANHQTHTTQHDLPDHTTALAVLFDWLHAQPNLQLSAAGHRLVHGGPTYRVPQRVTPQLLANLRSLIPFAPDHLPAEINLIEAVIRLYPDLPQVVCFDTAFHQTMPDRAKRLPIPRHLADEGLIRYGFHGLSYEYVLGQLAREAGGAVAQGRILLAHLGNGASMAAVRQGESIDTTMGFTPTGGLMMGTRSGDLDPGVLLYLLRSDGGPAAAVRPDDSANGHLAAPGLSRLLNDESGLRGVSGISSDMAELLEQAPQSAPAAEAIELFCYLAKKQLGGLVAVLNGLDTLVFTGGIGENAPAIRAGICAQLDFLGIALDAQRNADNAAVISPEGHTPVVRVIPTNEELMIARHTRQILAIK
ncbi:MAG: acetate/propionate family kinase [Rudanella sp.]|nr:acetate/propionate family kinase [Rudanella sp.]